MYNQPMPHLSRSPRVLAILAQSNASIEAGRGLTADEFWASVAPQPAKPKRKKPASAKP